MTKRRELLKFLGAASLIGVATATLPSRAMATVESRAPLRIGDVVTIIPTSRFAFDGDGRLMTVASFDAACVRCDWFEGRKHKHGIYSRLHHKFQRWEKVACA